jgi:hypothetical protein
MAAFDKYEIDLAVRSERYYRDTNQWENLRKLWVPDASKTLLSMSWYVLGCSIVNFSTSNRKTKS